MFTFNRIGNCKNPFQGKFKKVLCVCSAGLLRSPTAAFVLSNPPYNFNTRAVGIIEEYALISLEQAHLHWADEIVCMSMDQYTFIKKWLDEISLDRKVINLNVPDIYEYRSEELINLIKQRYEDIEAMRGEEKQMHLNSEGKYYFWEKDFLKCQGPFNTKKEAEDALIEYNKKNGGRE